MSLLYDINMCIKTLQTAIKDDYKIQKNICISNEITTQPWNKKTIINAYKYLKLLILTITYNNFEYSLDRT